MSEPKQSTLRIDWFDGTLIEGTRSSNAATDSLADEDAPETKPQPENPTHTEKKPIGFKRLLDISLLQPPLLTLEVAHRPGFWNLFDGDLKGDFIVLIVKVLAQIYNTLEPGEKSKIATQLKTKFETSSFLNLLKEYLINLPQVRISEKKMNFQLWDDVNTFYNNVVSLCEGIVKYGENTPEFLNQLCELLDVTESSALGVKEEHTETFSEDFFVRIHQLLSKILDLTSEEKTEEDQPTKQTMENEDKDPTSYKNLSVFPSTEDLCENSKIEIKPNIINGAYPSVKHYLDLQFKLLREDCFGPLRDGICKYLENPTKRRFENIRVYPKVRVLRTYVSNNKVGHLVDLAWKERLDNGNVDKKKYSYNKQLMFGSLLIFTCDNFETIMCATVLDSSLELLKDGYVAASFQEPLSKRALLKQYLMVESEVFFEPYHRVLKVLQSFDDLPMKRYIVDVQTETKPPAYLSSDTTYSIIDPKSEALSFPVLDTDQWPPSKAFALDDSQMEAYKFALTREFAVIQGPPGTGKTFIGVKIASTLLRNMSLVGTPMLIICYTNHALDQFLEGILLGITNSIVRLGSQSKNKNLEPYSLYNLRGKLKSKYSHLYGSKRSELEKIFNKMTNLQSKIELCEKSILSYNTIRRYLYIDDKRYKLELLDPYEDPVLSWLFDDLTEEDMVDDGEDDEQDKKVECKKKDEEDDIEVEGCFSEQEAIDEMDVLADNKKFVQDLTATMINKSDSAERKIQSNINRMRKRLSCFKKYMKTLAETDKLENPEKVADLKDLTQDQRWCFYYKIARCIKNRLLKRINNLLEQHEKCSSELNEVATLIDAEVLRTVRVVGVTTTTAARRHDLLRSLKSPIVIVEEAAEVLEAHIVASLTDHCEHLILIGDHKQLRPSASHFELAKDFNLDISLFERMIRNRVHARALSVQRRMRPEFVGLLVPTIYESLESHPSVVQYPDVRGMGKNLFFLTHDVLEDSDGTEDSWSHKNTLEANWSLALADYLRRMKYKSAEITILSTYNGQVTLLKELSKKYSKLRDVKITAVDNYQGEENRIVILSLVRSNKEGNIGFLAAPNRICVALSRAKEGFYIFGNMDVLKSASNIWRSIDSKLTAQNAIGKQLLLKCVKHNGIIRKVAFPEDLSSSSLKNICLSTCEIK
ncbi:NFX1-type zinc finger-containing protein 1-like [Ostrinia nubilalis]|uniref:NFX1-type zinc finger-containing protein 1-like n=1 Tax=Ostrinia nubilalis TaxID=29057 RepID=UPI00308265B5